MSNDEPRDMQELIITTTTIFNELSYTTSFHLEKEEEETIESA